jgi:ornithine cyclodeaminase
MQVYSQKTGRLEELLLDEGVLTELRTAAVGALAARLLAPKDIQTIGILGTGVQARYQLAMLPAVTGCTNVLVWGRSTSKVIGLIEEMNSKGWHLSAAGTPDQLLERCDLIVTTTCSRDPVLGNTVSTLKTMRKNKTGGLLIVCIGADAPGKIELNPASLVAEADLLVADTRSQSIERGEFQKAADDGLIQPESIIPLGGLIQKTDLHRARGDLNDDRLIIFDSSGVALQDCVVASLVVATIRQKVLERSLT